MVCTSREVGEEALQEACRGIAVAPLMDFRVDVAGGAVDGDVDIALAPFQRRQVLEIDVDEADLRLFKNADPGLVRLGSLADPVALETTMDRAAGELVVDASPDHFDDIVQRQLQGCTQFANQRFFHWGKAGHQSLRPMRTVGNRAAATPASDRGLADPQLSRQVRDRLRAALDIRADPGGCGRVGV
jgi:hypothetical protein